MRTPDTRALRALLFDFDHTLSDFGRWVEWKRARDEIAALYEAAGIDAASVLRGGGAFAAIGRLHEAVVARAGSERAEPVRARAYQILEEYECDGAEKARLLPGTADAIADAVRRGMALAIVSANAERPIRRVLARHGIEGSFQAIIGRSASLRMKPDPDMHREALRQLDRTSGEALAIGDSIDDMKGGVAAGTLAVGIAAWPDSTDILFEAGATWVLADLGALPTLLAFWEASAG